ncbi:MAG: carboxy terminal-processing peptidase [bacterium]
MKKLLIVAIFLSTAFGCNAQNAEELANKNVIDSNKVVVPDEIQPKVERIVTRILTENHYKKTDINDSLSVVIYESYLKMLDPNKMYFLKSDIDKFSQYKYSIDDFLKTGNLEAPFTMFNTYKQRIKERTAETINQLTTQFDFSGDEYYTPDRKDALWAGSKEELNNIWRKRLMNETLSRLLDNQTWDKISENLIKRYKNFHKLILQYDAEDVFQLYLNAFATSIDPHSSYFSPVTAENFGISMSLSLEGIGAQLTLEDDYTTVSRVIPGGPADKSNLVKNRDKIVSVAQGADGEYVDVVGWRLDDVVKLIRGPKGTTVKLVIIHADAPMIAPPDTITLVRDKIKLEDQAARKKILNIEENNTTVKLGVIEIDEFYFDWEGKRRGDKDYKSTTRDVEKILDSLKHEGVDGVIIDLRNNGGGSLQEAIDLTGLFIKTGPVVQIRNANGSIEVGRDYNAQISYDGPLVVLVNYSSASASEIFSGAIQDYGRGLILGDKTYGKGTVQNLVDLNMFMPQKKNELGQVKLTIAKYYRITGNSTQKKGVEPDIEFPSVVDPDEFGEDSQPTALAWDTIEPTSFEKYKDYSSLLPKLKAEHDARVKNDPEFQNYVDEITDLIEMRKQKSISLNYDIRKKEKEELDSKQKQRDEDRQTNTDFDVEGVEEVTPPTTRTDDPVLEESGRILADLIQLTIG